MPIKLALALIELKLLALGEGQPSGFIADSQVAVAVL